MDQVDAAVVTASSSSSSNSLQSMTTTTTTASDHPTQLSHIHRRPLYVDDGDGEEELIHIHQDKQDMQLLAPVLLESMHQPNALYPSHQQIFRIQPSQCTVHHDRHNNDGHDAVNNNSTTTRDFPSIARTGPVASSTRLLLPILNDDDDDDDDDIVMMSTQERDNLHQSVGTSASDVMDPTILRLSRALQDEHISSTTSSSLETLSPASDSSPPRRTSCPTTPLYHDDSCGNRMYSNNNNNNDMNDNFDFQTLLLARFVSLAEYHETNGYDDNVHDAPLTDLSESAASSHNNNSYYHTNDDLMGSMGSTGFMMPAMIDASEKEETDNEPFLPFRAPSRFREEPSHPQQQQQQQDDTFVMNDSEAVEETKEEVQHSDQDSPNVSVEKADAVVADTTSSASCDNNVNSNSLDKSLDEAAVPPSPTGMDHMEWFLSVLSCNTGVCAANTAFPLDNKAED